MKKKMFVTPKKVNEDLVANINEVIKKKGIKIDYLTLQLILIGIID